MPSHLATLLTLALPILIPNAVIAAPSPPLQTAPSTLSISLLNPLTLANPLSCLQLNRMNTKLDELVHYPFPASIPKEKAYAVASFTHAYKVLVNAMHGGECTARGTTDMNTEMEIGFNMTLFEKNQNQNQNNPPPAKRQDNGGDGIGDVVVEVLCVIVDTILGDNGGEAIPTESSSSAEVVQPTATVTGSGSGSGYASGRAVRRQDQNNGDEGIVEDLLELVGTILQIILGCEIGEESGDGGEGGGGARIY